MSGIMGDVSGAPVGTWVGLSEDDDPDYVARAERDWETTHITVEPLSVLDVAAWIIEQHGAMDAYKLQKLCYYAQAQHLAAFNTRLFVDPIEGWVNGPVVPRLYSRHAGKRFVKAVPDGSPLAVDEQPQSRATLEEVWARYGSFTGTQLSEMAHREQPWITSREGLRPREAGRREIRVETLRDYYGAFTSIEAFDVSPDDIVDL
jgi:uncharacterized phage-associated protein